MPARFVKVDLVDRLSPPLPIFGSQALIALSCAALAVLSRAVVDIFFPSAGPFALTFPFVLLATLFGRWGAGVGVMCFCAAYAWYVVLPVSGSFTFENPTDGPRVVINVLSGFLIVALAEYFRRVVRHALRERDIIAQEQRLLLEEVDHRVKNNFAMVGAMIRIEIRSASEEAALALQKIRGRVESIARAHEALYRGEGGVSQVAMRPYLKSLCASLDNAYLNDHFTIAVDVDELALSRDKAVAVGLVVNELCTNAAKHAFVGRDGGQIAVQLAARTDAVVVTVADDGVGFPSVPVRKGSLGQGLVEAFAEQAGGSLERVDVESGTEFRLVLPAV
jgi:two-component sensor histidine kinase